MRHRLPSSALPSAPPRSGGWVLERGIPGGHARDAMGCYPLFVCQDWRALEADLEELDGLVSVSLVTDPFGDYDEDGLAAMFSRRRHPVQAAFRHRFEPSARRHRLAPPPLLCAQGARSRVGRTVRDAGAYLDEWIELYGHLIARHSCTGIKAFSRAAFASQLRIPGIVMLRATCEGETVGAHLWYRQGDVVHSHLAAMNARGYELMASYALYWFALQNFAGEASWLNLGVGLRPCCRC